MNEVPHWRKAAIIDHIAGCKTEFLNFTSELGVCYDTVDGAREVFWTERNKNELIVALRPGQEDEAQVEIFIDPSDSMLQIYRKIEPFL